MHDARGFYYFAMDEGTANMGKISRAIALFIYTLIEHYANAGKDPMRALFDSEVDLELCQELVLHNKVLFDQLEIFSGTDLQRRVNAHGALRAMQKTMPFACSRHPPLFRYY